MKITCNQMDVLISFYLEGDLSNSLKTKVEEHLANCPTCKAKFKIIKDMVEELKYTLETTPESSYKTFNSQYKCFKNQLSAYVDNELPNNENLKIKKYTINNKFAREDLENTYSIQRLMKESFKKTKSEMKNDYSKKIIKEVTPNEHYNLSFHPAIKFAIFFIVAVLIISSIVIYSFTL